MDIMITDVSQITGHSEDDGSMVEIVKKVKDPSNTQAQILGVDECIHDIEEAIEEYDLVKDKPLVWRQSSEIRLQNMLFRCGVTEAAASGRATALEFVKNYRIGEEGHYQLLRKLVDFGAVCEAAEILFGNVGRESEYFPNAINYMVNSPPVYPETEYACGDAELETLLD